MGKVFALVIVAVLIIFGLRFLVINKATKPQETISPSRTAAPTQSSNYPGTTEFISSKSKIAFNYLPTVDNQQFKTLESGNKVYVYPSNMKPEDGQFVEVFEKNSQETLEEAIKKRFLSGKAETDCWVVNTTTLHKNLPDSYKTAEITFPKPTDSDEPWFSLSEKCSQDYAQTNGIRYFLEDTNYPDRFVFVSIGQYAILAGENITWQDTLRFIQ